MPPPRRAQRRLIVVVRLLISFAFENRPGPSEMRPMRLPCVRFELLQLRRGGANLPDRGDPPPAECA